MSQGYRVLLVACACLAGAGCPEFGASKLTSCENDSNCPSGYACVDGSCRAHVSVDSAVVRDALGWDSASADRAGIDATASDLRTSDLQAADATASDRSAADASLHGIDVASGADGFCPACPTCWGNAANFDADDLQLDFSAAVDLSGCSPTIDTSLDPGTMLTGWCGPQPAPVVQSQVGGPSLVVVPMASLLIGAGHTLRLIGDKPVVIAVRGDATIHGVIDAGAQGTAPGAGGDLSTDGVIATVFGADGTGDCNVFAAGTGQGMNQEPGNWSLAGGGAGFRTNGGFGGGERNNFRCYSNPGYTLVADGYECKPLCPDLNCDSSFNNSRDRFPANNGAHYVVSPIYGLAASGQSLTPLRGGCAGGRGESLDTSTAYHGGSGGGAVQLSVAGTLTVGAGGIVSAGGGGGTVIGRRGSGSGGGSGGAILLEATLVDISAAAGIRAHGGSGGGRRGSDTCSGTAESGHLGDDAYATHSSPAVCVGEGRGGLSYWDIGNPDCDGTGASIGAALACTLPVADWPTSATAYPQGGNITDDNGGGGGGGSGGVIIVRRLALSGACP